MKKLENMYEQMKSETTAEELAEKVIRSAEVGSVSPKRSYRKAVGFAAGFAAVCVFAVGVGAVNNWNYAEAFSRLFGEKAEQLTEYFPTDERVIENTFENVDFSIEAAAVSNGGMYLVLNAQPKNNAELGENFFYAVKVDSEINDYSGYCLSGDKIESNSHSDRTRVIVSGEMNGGTMTVTVSDCSAEPEGKWVAEFTACTAAAELVKEENMEIGFPTEEVSPANNMLIQGSDNAVKAEKITVTAINAWIDGVFEMRNGAVPNKGLVWAELKNGERVFVCNVASRGEVVEVKDGVPLVEGRIYMTFEEPIDISQLAAVVFDNERVEFTAAE